MKIYDATVLVTGAHRGLGLALVRESLALDALEAGAEEVLADQRARRLEKGLSTGRVSARPQRGCDRCGRWLRPA